MNILGELSICECDMDRLDGNDVKCCRPSSYLTLNYVDICMMAVGVYWIIGGTNSGIHSLMNIYNTRVINVATFVLYIIPLVIIVPIVFSGLYLLVFRNIKRMYARGSIEYIINEKEIIKNKWKGNNCLSVVEVDKIRNVEYRSNANGQGTIYINCDNSFYRCINYSIYELRKDAIGQNAMLLVDIPNVYDTYMYIRSIINDKEHSL